MKILGLSFSPRVQGNTDILLEAALSSAQRLKAETELYTVAGKDIHPCDGCASCWETGKCHIEDDMQEVYQKMQGADGIIFGTPVYFYNMTAQGKTVIDRTFALGRSKKGLANKVGGIVAVGGSLGLVDAVKDLYFFMIVARMLPASFVAAYGGAKGDVKKLPKCMQAARNLGKQVVKIAEKKFKYPKDIEAPHFAFGTHTR